jgi:hypothetical protein
MGYAWSVTVLQTIASSPQNGSFEASCLATYGGR